MRRKGTDAQLAVIRQRGLALLEQGKKTREVAELLNVTMRAVQRWKYEVKHPRKKAARPPGRPRKLSAKQVKRLEKALDRGAYAFGYAENYWTLDRIAHVIWELFEVRYTPSAVWHVMQRMGWSSQRPQRVPLQRGRCGGGTLEGGRAAQDKKSVANWALPSVLEDESGFSMVSPLKRTWSRRGQTPNQRTSIAHNERLNLLGALLISPKGRKIKLSIQSYWHSLTGKEVIAFLQQLLRIVSGPLVLVIDRHPIYKRKMVQEFMAKQKRLHVFYFPVAAPELNPVGVCVDPTQRIHCGNGSS